MMLKSYLVVALRSLLKRRGYSAINVVGLSAGLAAVIVIVLFARHEIEYDRFHEQSDGIYLAYKERITPTGTQVTRDTWVPLAARLESEYPAVEETVRIWEDEVWIRHGDRRFEEAVTYADPSLFNVFTFELAQGDPRTALDDLHSAVVSEDFVRRFFGDEAALGRTIDLGGTADYTITGVLADIPSNSSIDLEVVVPLESLPWYGDVENEWGGSFLYTYVLLEDAASAELLHAQFPDLIRRIWDEETASRTTFELEALPDLYNSMTGNRRYAYILLGVAFIILLIAAINFINLATARSLERAREIGMRKVLGAHRRQLIFQFIGESTLLSLAALGVAVLVVQLALPAFNEYYGVELSLRSAASVPTAIVVLGILVGVAAGLYPALFISSYRPAQSLRGFVRSGGARLRHGLVVVQFALAVALIAGTLVMRNQIRYMQEAELKFDSENVVVVDVSVDDFEDPDAAASRLETFKQEIERSSSIASVSSASHSPGRWSGWFTFVRPEGGEDEDPLRMRVALVDDRYFEAYDMELIDGRAFDRARAEDPQASVIINEAAVEAFGWTGAVGRTLHARGDTYTVVGVVRDYHFDSLRDRIAPVLHFNRPDTDAVHGYVAARIRPGQTEAGLEAIRGAWAELDPGRELPYEFAERTFAGLYEREQQLAAVTGGFSMLAVVIACLGLLGLASWSVAQRVKEVGIRKVLGASVTQIVLLLSRDFLLLVAAALLIGIPIAYLAMDEWLAQYSYSVPMGAGAFVGAGASALVIAFATVSLMAARAALTDPVQSLRNE